MNKVLKNSRTMMDHFRASGYQTLGTGKLMHDMVRQEWKNDGNKADYGPFAFDGKNKIAHPDVPTPYREIARSTDPLNQGNDFVKHPTVDSDKDGKLTWPEYKAYRAKPEPEPTKPINSEVKK